jgi:hypothetical protein
MFAFSRSAWDLAWRSFRRGPIPTTCPQDSLVPAGRPRMSWFAGDFRARAASTVASPSQTRRCSVMPSDSSICRDFVSRVCRQPSLPPVIAGQVGPSAEPQMHGRQRNRRGRHRRRHPVNRGQDPVEFAVRPRLGRLLPVDVLEPEDHPAPLGSLRAAAVSVMLVTSCTPCWVVIGEPAPVWVRSGGAGPQHVSSQRSRMPLHHWSRLVVSPSLRTSGGRSAA